MRLEEIIKGINIIESTGNLSREIAGLIALKDAERAVSVIHDAFYAD